MSARQDRQPARAAAVKQIAASFKAKSGALLIGAGCSATADIPLAPKLVQEALTRFDSFCHDVDPLVPNAYGTIMARLDPEQRRDLLLPHIAKAKLNWGHIAIAYMMQKGLARRVLSVNFDPVLARCCGLLGLYPAIYDFGAAPAQNLKGLAEPAIIHLHGQSTGFVQLNTEAETKAHVANLRAIIADSIQSRPVVVIGYSGTSDGVLDALADAYDDHTRLYWVDLADTPSAPVAAFLAGKAYAHFVGGSDADRFLVDVVQELARITGETDWTPQIFHDPVGHLLREMAPVNDFPVTTKDTDDILAQWRANMALLKSMHDREFGGERTVEALQIQGDTAGIAKAVSQAAASAAPASKALSRAAYWAKLGEGNEHYESGQRLTGAPARAAVEQAAAAFNAAIALDPTPHEALNNWGNALVEMAKRATDPAEADRLFTLACAKYEAALAIKPDKHEALNNWGNALVEMAKRATDPAEADRLFTLACAKYEAALAIKPDKHEALNNWGNALVEMAKRATDPAEADRLFALACAKYEAALAIKPDCHEALNNWGNTLLEMAKRATDPAEADRLFALCCAKYEAALAIKPDYHEALYNWGSTLLEMAKRATDPAEADRLFALACAKYEAALAIKPDKHEALNNWGTMLLEMAKRATRPAERAAHYEQAAEKLAAAERLEPGAASYNLACLMALTGLPDPCQAYLRAAHAHGRLPTRAHLDADTDLDAVRALPWFGDIRALSR